MNFISNFNIKKEELKIDYSRFEDVEKQKSSIKSSDDLKEDEISTLKSVGIDFERKPEAGMFLMYGVDVFTFLPKIEGVEIIPLKEALKLYPDIKEKYYFNAINKDQDEFTKIAFEKDQNGFFIRVRKNVKIKSPLNSALFMHKEMSTMCIHNIVVIEEGAELHLITGCVSGCTINGGLHIAISENYVEKDAKFVNTMIHNWGKDFIIRPRTATIVDDNGTFVSNYYSIKPPKQIETNPFTHLKGKNANAKYMSAILSLPETYSDIGGTVLITGEKSGAELVARAVNHGGTVIQTGLLIGAAKDSRAHVDCSGLMLDENGIIEAIPGLKAMHPDAKMSHEAAIGKIDIGVLNYLQSKGLDEMQAITLIVRGFLNLGIEVEGLEPELESAINKIANLSGHGEL